MNNTLLRALMVTLVLNITQDCLMIIKKVIEHILHTFLFGQGNVQFMYIMHGMVFSHRKPPTINLMFWSKKYYITLRVTAEKKFFFFCINNVKYTYAKYLPDNCMVDLYSLLFTLYIKFSIKLFYSWYLLFNYEKETFNIQTMNIIISAQENARRTRENSWRPSYLQ